MRKEGKQKQSEGKQRNHCKRRIYKEELGNRRIIEGRGREQDEKWKRRGKYKSEGWKIKKKVNK